MARMGSFSRGAVAYGIPLSFVKPADNVYQPPSPLDGSGLTLTEAQRQELEDRISELYQTYRGERDYL